ncbi:nucleolar protein of 40 kDa-like [Venturia canescens]|uniref:nucleolar protein of 40 kDa-like n=1 Tax=Venturia canescens TaxID=32260 RepID=UPI001C9D0540|nr:nucleolar protein of 40 kDa-like [Venturia canescens]
MSSCELNQIFLGEIASVQNYGAFVRIPGCKQQGLIHKSQVSSARVDDVADVLQRGERVWCKVINISDDGKVGLSMKHVNQGNGKDLDPNGIEQQMDEQRRKKFVPGQKRPIELEAVLDTTCTKCGTRGHLASDCFSTPDGKKYELLPEVEELPEATVHPPKDDANMDARSKSHKRAKKKKKLKKSRRSDGSSDDESDDSDTVTATDENDEHKRRSKKSKDSAKKKKRTKKDKRKKRENGASDSSTNQGESRRREGSDKKSKKCKHSRSKHSD